MKKTYYFRKLLKDGPIRNKIIGIYIPLIIIPLTILGTVSNYIFTETIIQSTIKSTFDESMLISEKIEMIIDNVENSANNIAKNLNCINNNYGIPNILGSNNDQKSAVVKKNLIMDQLAFEISQDIDSITFIDNYNNIYCTSYIVEKDKQRILTSDFYKEVDKTDGSNTWLPMNKEGWTFRDSNEPVIILGKKILDKSSGKKLGILFITIKEISIYNVYRGVGSVSEKGYLIVDNSGLIVSSKDKSELFQPFEYKFLNYLMAENNYTSKIEHIDGEKVLFTSDPIKSLGWYLIDEIHFNEINSSANKVTIIIVVVGILCIFIYLLGAIVLSNIISKPILQLTEKMQKVKEGNFDVHYDIDSTDEIGMMASVFNKMTTKIKELLTEVEFEQGKKREFELALMQSQIKPHFLYNTLDLIYILCKMGQNEEAKETTKALADFYKVILSNGCEMITIREEIRNIDNYLYIQKSRYSDVFDYKINISNEILDYNIPKLTIQPIVENAIYHGLKPKGSLGSIVIEGFFEEDKIVIFVRDDGVGIEADKLEHLLENKHDIKKSFGIRNVNERLRLYFGESYGLKLESKCGIGTTIAVILPKNFGKNEIDK